MPEIDLAQLFSEQGLREIVWPWVLQFGAKSLRFLLILTAAAVAARVLGRILQEAMERVLSVDDEGEDPLAVSERRKRTATIANVSRRAVAIVVWVTAAVMALSEIGFDIGPLVAGAGVVGVALGFGAQNLVRDFLAGFFILLENQIRVGDVAVVNNTGGLVEQINLRTTVLRDLEGTVHVFANGAITSLSNKTRDYSCHVFDVGVAYKEDADAVVELISQTVQSMREHSDFKEKIIGDPEIFGLDKFGESAIVIKGRIRTVPGQQWSVGREFNRRLKKLFDEKGVEIPFPHRKLITEKPVVDS